ncbi:replication initiation negative regulator SeqA [Alteromonas sediminis]|uniref:Negative modulator of initiation of replication n=1 Tax=Alteromonas sediminis TaxID=2259342 RepID=A0A3N5Y373_9ALTE|nr:replication initiation negative regulator SeqA [Alteromonas sediminis]RPJ67196.1 replication initiation negative regulator SeqA [Alteromonas sediminis]
MKNIEVDDDLYAYIASQTQSIGESASQILRRLLLPESGTVKSNEPVQPKKKVESAVDTKADKSAPVQVASGDEDATLETRITAERLAEMPKKVAQFLYILGELSALHPEKFASVESIRGKDRLYFAASKEALEASGTSINAKAIPHSTYWVVTNNNSAKKISILRQVMALLNYNDSTIDKVIALFKG